LFEGVEEGTDGEAVEAAAEGGVGGDAVGAQAGSGPVLGDTGPGDGAVVEGGPEEDGDEDPGLVLDILLAEALSNILDGVV
jgi:hypothetical protein